MFEIEYHDREGVRRLRLHSTRCDVCDEMTHSGRMYTMFNHFTCEGCTANTLTVAFGGWIYSNNRKGNPLAAHQCAFEAFELRTALSV